MSRPKREPPREALTIESATHDGRGIAHVDGKVVFVSGALPGERVVALRRPRRRGFDEATTIEILTSAAGRVQPSCTHFGLCGGCSLQHADAATQRALKQQALADNLARIGKIAPADWFEPITGPVWHYRRRARLSARFVDKKGRMLVGFREREGRGLVADLAGCKVLAVPAGQLIAPLAEALGGLRAARGIPQIEVAVADNVTILVIRHLSPLDDADRAALRAFAATHGVEIHLQPAGYESVIPLDPPGTQATYALPEYGIEIRFAATDFVQVNGEVNRKMVARAVELLDAGPDNTALDLFCGIGNFTLPLARRAGHVTGVEGDAALVARATDNAVHNGISNVEFHTADLFKSPGKAAWATQRYDRLLLDPPRAGAQEIIDHIPRWRPKRVVYVSCHPGTLSRDAGVLVKQHGYTLAGAGIIDMFPHTAHVESIALFIR
ncbi:MAG: 23S rRNA (uracil(1939)-C(5))-methyltransferase RlmD [Gammaproteobacteria bacterium]